MRVQRVLLVGFCGLLVAAALSADSQPLAVSPGDPSRLVLIGDTCPTFSWGQVDGARNYELVVYHLGNEGDEARPVLRQGFAGSVSSWTPSLDRCLERNGQYAWSVRAVDGAEASDWSAPSLFQVAAGPSAAEFEQALQVVRTYLDARAGAESASGVAGESQAEPESKQEADAPAPSPMPRGAGTTQLSVDGGVVATSFTGDGSTLTSLDPASLSAGKAGIDISGTAATASDLVGTACVSEAELDFDPATQAEMTIHAATADAHREHASLEESAEIDTDVADHAALANAHHAPPSSLPPSGPAGGGLTGSYPNPQIASNAVSSLQVQDNSLTASDLASNSVGSSELQSNSVYAGEIATGAVGASEMQGSFCLVRLGGNSCPPGYSYYYIRWDTEDISNEDICGTPAWSCSGSTITLYFCCK